MNKYVIVVLINLPLIVVGILGAIVDYKAARTISKRKCITLVIMWLLIGVGLVFIEPIYNALIRSNLTDSAPMSIFDAGLLTMILFCLLFIIKTNQKLTVVNRKLSRVHEKLAMLEAEGEVES
jgi:hypothetical protein